MNRIVLIALMCMSLLFSGCMKQVPGKNDIVGIWVSNDGAILEFKEDGTFDGKSLPGEHFTHSQDEVWKDFDGSGNWKLEDGQQFWQIELEFKEKNNQKGSYGYQVYVSGSNTFENKPPWYLFVWEYNDIDTGDRYKFTKKE